jgi:hypothetical protein
MDVRLKEVTLSMPFVWEASAYEAGQDEKFSAHFIIEKGSENEKVVRAALVTEAEKLWKGNAMSKLKTVAAAGKLWCLRDGDGKTDKEGNVLAGYAGKLYVSAKNTIRPLLLGADRAPVTQADDKLYPGAVVNAIIDVRVNNRPSDQAYAYLKGIQFVRDGTRLGGGAPATVEDFEEIVPAKKDNKTASADALFNF